MKNLISLLIIILVAAGNSWGATVCFEKHVETEGGPATWNYEFGVAMITSNSIEDFVGFGDSVSGADGPEGGEIYTFTISRRLGQLVWNTGGHTFTPQIELPFTLEVVNENSQDPFLAFSGSLNVRWVDFPWNDYIKTTFSMGIGLNYSDQIYQIDQVRHPGDDRSHLKFNWPIQATLALPDYPDKQLMIFIIHHSGGNIFDDGGMNGLGFGYRGEF